MTIRMDGGTPPRAAMDSSVAGGSSQIGKREIQEHELKLLCACLAALARRTNTGLVIPLADIEAEHERLWLARNRPGGLVDSKQRLEQHLAALEA